MLPNRFRRTAPAFILITFYGAVQMIPASMQPAPNTPTLIDTIDRPAVNAATDLDTTRQAEAQPPVGESLH